MEAVKSIKQKAVVTCHHCDSSFKVEVEGEEYYWQHFIFQCPKCKEMNCIPRNEIIK